MGQEQEPWPDSVEEISSPGLSTSGTSHVRVLDRGQNTKRKPNESEYLKACRRPVRWVNEKMVECKANGPDQKIKHKS
jgi:hypothetical protein